MIKGTGIDIVEIFRIQESLERSKKLPERILTSSEMEIFHTYSGKRKLEFLAGRFAAKEAFSKAAGTGIGASLSFKDMEIASDEWGRPYFTKPKRDGVHLSISHSEQYAVAQVIIEE